MKCVIATTTFNRHTLLERVIGSFLQQDYKDCVMVIFNSGAKEELDKEYDNIFLIENSTDLVTGNPYSNIGDKYRDFVHCIEALVPDVEVINFCDSDYIMMPNHVTEGINGFLKAKGKDKLAYKPYYSFLKSKNAYSLHNNVCEGSIFIDFNHIKSSGFLPMVVKYHDGWLLPLVEKDKILVDKDGIPTWIYTWNEDIPTYKTSGAGESQQNFLVSQSVQKDTGDGVLIPWSLDKLKDIYGNVEQLTGTLQKN